MWETPVPIFEDEDEDELIAKFVDLSARYKDRDAYEITAYIFKNLREPTRALQAATIWSSDLGIKERIEAIRRQGFDTTPIDSKETKLRKLEAIYNNEDIAARDRLKALELHAQIQGEIKKPGDEEDADKPRTVVLKFGLDPRAANAA